MTEALEIRTRHADVSDVLSELARAVDDESIRLPSERAIPEGDWVRFAVSLADGTVVFEGIGRSQGSAPLGRGQHVQLGTLQLDGRNEVMYERMLLMRDAEEERTGTMPLREPEVAALVRGGARSGAPQAPARPAGTNPPPAPAPAAPAPAAPAPAARPVPRPSSPEPRPSARPPAQATPALRPSAAPPASEAPPPRAVPSPGKLPEKAASKTASAPSKPSVPAKLAGATASPASKPVVPGPATSKPAVMRPKSAPPASRPEPDDSATAEHAMPPPEPRRRRRASKVPVEEAAELPEDTIVSRPGELTAGRRPMHLEVRPHLLARARALAPTLPSELIDPRASSPEEAVLRAAIRLGLASLAALRDED